ncbi:hypothetical protein I4U23_009364 [Adineta vaga]|nr:hypothetical protein I4U23_009364 [Adineta vaga]
MQRFHRLGSVGMALIISAFTFHLVAISLDRWTSATCKTCPIAYEFREWRTSIRERCYRTSMLNFLKLSNDSEEIKDDPFTTYVCISNKYLRAKDSANNGQCIGSTQIDPQNACTSGQYNSDLCECTYSKSTKAVIGLAIVSSFALGIMVIVSHFGSYIQYDFILKWLIPGGFFALVTGFGAIFIILIMMGSGKYEDVDEIVNWRTLEATKYPNISAINNTNLLNELYRNNFDVNLGISFGMEIIAGHFTLMSAIIYALMFIAKKRPDA